MQEKQYEKGQTKQKRITRMEKKLWGRLLRKFNEVWRKGKKKRGRTEKGKKQRGG